MGLKATKAKIAYSVDGTAPPEFHAPEHLPPGDDPIILPADIAAEQFVKWNGTKLIGAAAGAANQFEYYTFFDSIDGFEKECVSAMSFINGALQIYPSPPDIAFIRKQLYYTPELLTWDKNKVIQFYAYVCSPGDDVFCLTIFAGSDDLSELGIGIHFARNKIRGWCNDGSGRTYLDLITGWPDWWSAEQSYEIRSYPPTHVEFYIAGVYKGKIETHIPSGNDFASYVFGVYNKSGTLNGAYIQLSSFKHVQDLLWNTSVYTSSCRPK